MNEGAPASTPSRAAAGIRVVWRVMRANPLSFVGFVLVVLIVGAAVIIELDPRLIAPYAATQFTGAYNQAPSLAHPFGTDGNSFDIYSNVMLALPTDLGISVAVAGASLVIGGGLGLVVGYYDRPRSVGGILSTVILRVTDIFLAFPSLILALALTVSFGVGVWQATVAVLATWWPYYVRLVRGEVLAVKHLPYVTAAKAAGVPDGRILTRHILRNVLDPIVVYFTLDIGTVLVTFSTIGFIAKAIAYPSSTPEWGSMIAFYQGNGVLTVYPWLVVAPGLAIFVTVLAFSLLGDGIRDLLDPRTRRALGGGFSGPSSVAEETEAATTVRPFPTPSTVVEPSAPG